MPLPVVSKVTLAEADGVHDHHNERLPEAPAWVGSPASLLASVFAVRIAKLLPEMMARPAKSSLKGRLVVVVSARLRSSRPRVCARAANAGFTCTPRRARLMRPR